MCGRYREVISSGIAGDDGRLLILRYVLLTRAVPPSKKKLALEKYVNSHGDLHMAGVVGRDGWWSWTAECSASIVWAGQLVGWKECAGTLRVPFALCCTKPSLLWGPVPVASCWFEWHLAVRSRLVHKQTAIDYIVAVAVQWCERSFMAPAVRAVW